MTTNTIFVVVGAAALALCAVAAIEIAKRWRNLPRCPRCYSRAVHEFRGENVCESCDERWQPDE